VQNQLAAWGVGSFFFHAGKVFLSQSSQSSLSVKAHVSSTQKAFGIQRTQSVSAKDGCKVL